MTRPDARSVLAAFVTACLAAVAVLCCKTGAVSLALDAAADTGPTIGTPGDGIVIVADNRVESHDTIQFELSGFEPNSTVVIMLKGQSEDSAWTQQQLAVVVVDADGASAYTWDPPGLASDLANVWGQYAGDDEPTTRFLPILLDSIRTGTLTQPQGGAERDYVVHYCSGYDYEGFEPPDATYEDAADAVVEGLEEAWRVLVVDGRLDAPYVGDAGVIEVELAGDPDHGETCLNDFLLSGVVGELESTAWQNYFDAARTQRRVTGIVVQGKDDRVLLCALRVSVVILRPRGRPPAA